MAKINQLPCQFLQRTDEGCNRLISTKLAPIVFFLKSNDALVGVLIVICLKLCPHRMRGCAIVNLCLVKQIEGGQDGHNGLLIFDLPHHFVSNNSKS